MSDGVTAEIEELIGLQRFVSHVPYRPNPLVLKRGNHLSRLRGRGMEFAEVRNYQAGDEIRHMEWRVTARTGRAHIKVFEEEKEQSLILLVDFNPSMYFGTRIAFKSVIAARLAALLAWTSIKQGDRIGALLFSQTQHEEITPKSRNAGVLPLLASLSSYTKQFPAPPDLQTIMPGSLQLADQLIRLRRVIKPGAKLVLISDFYQMNADCEMHLARLAAHSDVIAFHISDVLELAPPTPGLYPISNSRGAETLLDLQNRKQQQLYQAWCDTRRANLELQFRRLKIRYVPVQAGDSLPHLVSFAGFRRSHA